LFRSAALLGHRLFRGRTLVLIALRIVILFPGIALQPRLDLGLELGELGVEPVAVLGPDLGAQGLVAAGEAQALDGATLELTFEPQRAFHGDLPVAEVGGVEPFALRRVLRWPE